MLSSADNNILPKDFVFPAAGSDNIEVFWNTYFAKYFKSVIGTKKNGSYFYVDFADGSSMRMIRGGVELHIEYDVNSFEKKPNSYGRDMYVYFLTREGKLVPYKWGLAFIDGSGIEKPVGSLNDRANVLHLCAHISGFYCTQLLRMDNWEYKKDYPHKL